MHPDTYGLIILEVAAIKIHLSISYFHGSSHLHAPAPPTSATSIIGVGLGHVAFSMQRVTQCTIYHHNQGSKSRIGT